MKTLTHVTQVTMKRYVGYLLLKYCEKSKKGVKTKIQVIVVTQKINIGKDLLFFKEIFKINHMFYATIKL